MSVFREQLVKHSRKNRRCVGCDNFVTIKAGDPYYSCWYADGGDAYGYAMCVPCREHMDQCKECSEAWRECSPGGTYECRNSK